MITPMRAPLTMRRNDNPWRVLFVREEENSALYDFTGHTARLHVRLYPGAGGAPLIEALSSDGTGTHLNCTEDGIEAVIEGAEIEGLPRFGNGANPEEAGKDVTFAYDLLVKAPGEDENAWFEGDVIVKAGVTQ